MRRYVILFLIIVTFLIILLINYCAAKNWSKFTYFDNLINESDAKVLYLDKSILGLNDLAIIQFKSVDLADEVWIKLDRYQEELNHNISFKNLNKSSKYSHLFYNIDKFKYVNFNNENGYSVYTTKFVRSNINKKMYLINLKSKK